jgi:hypothetical protein
MTKSTRLLLGFGNGKYAKNRKEHAPFNASTIQAEN